jgi:polysaccharide pyruvyl transferase WcaK-like protein
MFGLNLDYKHFVPVLLEELMKQTNARVLLVPHMYSSSAEGDELQVCHELYESIGEEYLDRIQLVNQKYDQSQIKGIIGLCDFFIGSRMHACIAALSQNIPTVGLAYSKKFYGVFESVDAQKFAIDMRQRNQEEIIEIVISAFEERNIIAQNLKNAISMAQNQIRNVFKEMLCQAES